MNVTLLDVVQRLLTDMDSDSINTISETIESTSVANVVKDVYEQIIDEHEVANHKRIFQLDGIGETARPTYLQIPDGYFDVEWFNYDKRLASTDDPLYLPVNYVSPEEFITRTNMRRSSDTNVDEVIDQDGGKFYIENDKPPEYFTSFNNDFIVCDSYDSAVESTLQGSKTQVYAKYRPTLALTDSAVIDLPKHLMSLLMAEARELVFELYKDGAPRKVSQIALRTRVRAQRTDHRLNRLQNPIDQLPDYGRRPRR